MSVYRPKDKDGEFKSPFFHYDFVVKLPTRESRRFYGSTGQTTKRRAEGVEDTVRGLAAEGKLQNALTLNDAAWRYYREVAESQPSAEDTAKGIEHLCRLIGPETPLIAVDANLISDAVRRRAAEFCEFAPRKDGKPNIKRLVSGRTVNAQIIEVVRAILRRARRTWKVPVDIEIDWKDLKRPESGKRFRPIKAAERVTMDAQTREDYRPIMEAYRLSGARKAALPGLLKSSIDWEWGDPELPLEFRGGFTIMLKRRRGEKPREHFVPFTPESRALFEAECAKSPLPEVFTYVVQRGKMKGMRRPITYNGLRRAWEGSRKGVEGIRFHDKRHDAATAVLRGTGNLAAAGELLGHADITSTQRYAHVLKDDLRRAMLAADYRNSPGAKTAEGEKNKG